MRQKMVQPRAPCNAHCVGITDNNELYFFFITLQDICAFLKRLIYSHIYLEQVRVSFMEKY